MTAQPLDIGPLPPPLFDLDQDQDQPGGERLGHDARRTLRQRDRLAAGIHPATLLPLHVAAPPAGDRQAAGPRCATCIHLWTKTVPSGRTFTKCALAANEATDGPDARRWWPACRAWQPTPPASPSSNQPPTRDPQDEILETVAADDSIPNKQASREAVIHAINTAINTSPDGTYTAATVRTHLPTWVNDKQIGAIFRLITLRNLAHPIPGRDAPSGNTKARNSKRHMPVYQPHTHPIPLWLADPEALAATRKQKDKQQ